MYSLDIYCQKGIFTSNVLLDIIQTKLDFVYNRIEFKKISKKNFASLKREDLESRLLAGNGDLYVDNSDGREFQTFHFIGSRDKVDGLHFRRNNAKVEKWISDLVFSTNKFLVAYEYEIDFHLLQNETSLGNLKAYGIDPPRDLFLYKDKFTPRINIDIRNNPYKEFWDDKRQISINISWRMWLSRSFLDMLPQKQIDSFKGLYEKKWINENVCFIQLFEHAKECWSQKNLEMAQAFRNYLGMDELLPLHLRYDKNLRENWDLLVEKYQTSDDARIW